MHLLNAHTYGLRQNAPPGLQYAILSHRWTGNEISFQDLLTSPLESTIYHPLRVAKVQGACKRARSYGLDWGVWIDSCCINRQDAVELSESITSMFQWYQEAVVCLAYLADVESQAPSHKVLVKTANRDQPSEWFSRGWTLQELLAPRQLRFYDGVWSDMGTREDLSREIVSITWIKEPYLKGQKDIRSASIAARMSWMAGRKTTKPEDIAYSMLGMFGVSLTPRYGEGVMAFQRLQQAIIASSSDESIFAWTSASVPLPRLVNGDWREDEWGLIAPSPHHFDQCGDITYERGMASRRSSGGHNFTRNGIMFPMQPMEFGLFPRLRNSVALTLNAWKDDALGRPRAIQVILRKIDGGREFRRQQCGEVKISSKKRPASSGAMYGGRDNVVWPLIVQPHSSLWA